MAKKKAPNVDQDEFTVEELTRRLKLLMQLRLPEGEAADNVPKALLTALRFAANRIERIEERLDPIRLPETVFSLTDPVTIGEVVVHRLSQRSRTRFADIRRFYGSGVYALYYTGTMGEYEAIAGTEVPIYVGSAGPDLPTANTPRDQGARLYSRISEHFRKSLSRSTNLQPDDFDCRFLVVQSGLEKSAEEFLIRLYHPVWNKESKVCSGFGKHGDIARLELSPWDVLHGDRGWTEHQESLRGRTPELVGESIQRHFRRLLDHDCDRWSKRFAESWIRKQLS